MSALISRRNSVRNHVMHLSNKINYYTKIRDNAMCELIQLEKQINGVKK